MKKKKKIPRDTAEGDLLAPISLCNFAQMSMNDVTEAKRTVAKQTRIFFYFFFSNKSGSIELFAIKMYGISKGR